jgi:hypothetical protein
MALLSQDELKEMAAFAAEQGQEQEDQQEPEQEAQGQTEQQAETPAPEAKQETQEPQQPSEPSAQQEQRKHHVPYDRFSQTIRERNEARQQLQQTQARLQQMEQQFQTRQAVADQVRSQLEQVGLVDPVTGETEDDGDPRVRQLDQLVRGQQKALEEIQVAYAKQELATELAAFQAQFPAVPRKFLLQQVAQNPQVNLEEVAHEFMSWVAPHLPQQPQGQAQGQAAPVRAPTPSAPPRPAKAGATSHSSAGQSSQKGWGDRSTRTAEVQSLLREMGWK